MRFLTYGLIASLFIVFVLMPETDYFPQDYTEFKALQLNGMLHIPSLLFILFSWGILSLSHYFHWNGRRTKRLDSNSSRTERVFQDTNSELDKLLNYSTNDKQLYIELKEKSEKHTVMQKLSMLFSKGAIEDDIDLIIAKEADRRIHTLKGEVQEISYIAGLLPMLGMVGTIAGLMLMFSNPDNMDDFGQKFSGLAIALMTTLYATLITALVVKPKQKLVSRRINELEHQAEILAHNSRLLYHTLDMRIFNHYLQTDDLSMLDVVQPDYESTQKTNPKNDQPVLDNEQRKISQADGEEVTAEKKDAA